MTVIKLMKRWSYGEWKVYPACPITRAVCLLMKRETLNEYMIDILRNVGECKVEFTEAPPMPKAAERKKV